MILVVSLPSDEHTHAVLEKLLSAGRDVVTLELASFPVHNRIGFAWLGAEHGFHFAGDVAKRDLSKSNVVWWRRARPFTASVELTDESEKRFAESEAAQAVLGALDSLPCPWVNPRASDEAATRKPFQWTVAQKVGLILPSTIVTSDPQYAADFVRAQRANAVVYKPLLQGMDWRETRLVEPADIARLATVKYAPVVFQEYVPGVDLRITIVGSNVFAAEIDATGTSYPIDMRMVIGEARVRPIALPAAISVKLLQLMRCLGISYGAVDMRRSPSGEHYFLEVNPGGQWLFVERLTGLPITQALATHLSDHEQRNLWLGER